MFTFGSWLTPKPLVAAALVADGEEKPKLAADRPRLGPTRMGRLANFPCYSLARGIGLRSLELVIMKEEGRVHCHCHVAESGHGLSSLAKTQ